MAKLNREKRKKSSFYEEKSLVGLTPVTNESVGILAEKIIQCF
jgi:hypothetical protein